VSEARGQTYTELYRKLDTKEGENDVYKMAKLRERKIRDFNQVKYIKNEADRLLVKDEEIKNRWREYFDKLFNDESEKITIELVDSIDTNRRFVRRIQESKVKETLKKMKTGKALGSYDILIEV
jgi:molecular chaperone GrpE (heat shock protein)